VSCHSDASRAATVFPALCQISDAGGRTDVGAAGRNVREVEGVRGWAVNGQQGNRGVDRGAGDDDQ
jgi:hypothetical protein